MRVDAVVVAAGRSERFGGEDKLLADLCGLPVVAWSIRALAAAPSVATIVVVTRSEAVRETVRQIGLTEASRLRFAPGGERRRDSVAAGLDVCTTEYVLVQDGARPFLTVELAERVIAAADGLPGAIAAVPVTDTIKAVDAEGRIVEHPDRARLWAAQTPQVVLRSLWLAAASSSDEDVTDDAAMLARLGYTCRVVEGDRWNIKVTYPSDLAIARALATLRGAPTP